MNNFNITKIMSGIFWTILAVAVIYIAIAILLFIDASDGTHPGDIYYWLRMDQFAHWFLGLVFGRG